MRKMQHISALVSLLCLPVIVSSTINSDPAPSLPQPLQDPYKDGPDPTLQNQPWRTNDPWGIYSGSAFCHNLCSFDGFCQETSTNTSQVLIESPVTLTINGEADQPGGVTSGFINFNWQEVVMPDGGYLGALGASYLPLTTSRPFMQDNISTAYIPSREEGSLAEVVGKLQVYAQAVAPLTPGSNQPWGWVFATFAGKPLNYTARYGTASLTGKVYVRYYSPSSLYTAVCAMSLSRTAKFSYQQNPPNDSKNDILRGGMSKQCKCCCDFCSAAGCEKRPDSCCRNGNAPCMSSCGAPDPSFCKCP